METNQTPVLQQIRKRRVAQRKYDWLEIRKQFLEGSWETVADYLKDKTLPPTLLYNKNFKEIIAEKQKKTGTDILLTAAAKDIQTDFSEEGKTRARHARIGRYLQIKGMEALKDPNLKIANPDDARKLIIAGVDIEEKAEGIQKDGSKNTYNQVNISIKTNIDRQLEHASYEEVLGIIAELKRAGKGSPTQKAPISSTTEVTEGEII